MATEEELAREAEHRGGPPTLARADKRERDRHMAQNTEFLADIPEALARAAHAGTSFVPEDRARQEREGYAATLAADWAALERLATTDEKRATLAAEFARYRQGYRRRTLAQLGAKSACLSTMIAGPSNFPTRRMQKRGATADKRLNELVEFRARALKAIRRALCPEAGPVMSGDSDAVERLKAKIEKAEAVQARMKEANAAIRKHAKAGPEAQVAALVALGITEPNARELIKPDFAGRVGFAAFETSNNAANIRRMRERVAQIERDQAVPVAEVEGENARLEDCPAENRVRLFFPGKPPAEVRTRLKRSGFRWAPSLGCWQAYRNHNAIEAARREAGL